VGDRSIISQLPAAERKRLEEVLVANGFSNYREIAQEMTERGYPIGKSALQKYGKSFEDRLASLKFSYDFAQAYKEVLPDEAGARSEMVVDLAQSSLFSLLLQAQDRVDNLDSDAGSEELTSLSTLIAKLSRSISDLSRSSVTVKRYAAEVKSKIVALADKPGVDKATLDRINREIFGG
jgi:HPt (histidine-containing phosphotransfer) domain-containing protein